MKPDPWHHDFEWQPVLQALCIWVQLSFRWSIKYWIILGLGICLGMLL